MATSDKRIVAPALPLPPREYNKSSFDQFNNVLRLYFRKLDDVLRSLTGTSSVSVKSYYTATGNYTLVATDYLVEYTSGSHTATLPSAVGLTGQEFEIKNSGTGTITVDADGAETIDGALTQALGQYDAMKIMSNGTNWMIV